MPAPFMSVETAKRLADLQDKLAARQDKVGFTKNTRAIREEIARLQAEEARDEQA